MKVVLLTSNSLRHKYIAASIARELDLVLIVTEKKSASIEESNGYKKEDIEFLAGHFKERIKTEARFFGAYDEFPKEVPRIDVPHGSINSSEIHQIIQQTSSELILLFGTSIVREPLLKTFKGNMINLHLGLSPFYKGSATNLFPYLYKEPECVGATIHMATSQVDQGAILHQFRPEIKVNDNLHEIGNSVIERAGQVLPEVLQKYITGEIEPQLQNQAGRLCRNKDLTPNALRKIYRNFEEGMIKRYLGEKEIRDRNKPIVEHV